MYFADLSKKEILDSSIDLGDYFEYTLGSPVEITTLKSLHKNDVIAKGLANASKEDKLMVKYSPTNKIYFSKNFILGDTTEIYSSMYVDEKNGRLYVGSVEEFGNMTGILAFSGYLSLNNLVESDRPILCTTKMRSVILERIKVLSLGVRGDKLYALFYIPNIKGLKLSIRGRLDKGISPVTYKISACKDCCSFTIKDWFDGLTKIKEV